MSPPWMPFYVGDYIGKTMHLSTLEHGVYLLLIMHYWQKGSLPTEDRSLASIVKLPLNEWLEMRPTIAAFFDAGWRHERVDKELANAQQMLSKRKAAGKAGAYARYGNRMADAQQTESQSDAILPKKDSSSSDNLEPSFHARVLKSLESPEGFFEAGELNSITMSYAGVDHAARLKSFWPWALGLGKTPTEAKAMYVATMKREAGSTALVDSRTTKPEVQVSPQLASSRLTRKTMDAAGPIPPSLDRRPLERKTA